ncbi:sigma factor [Actinokineospora sp. NBRC 105648]|uniref:sigma factor n=1 Tax=Actinokineospora sp. NBRC 105648 TaxID=3032206 RepID=UPI0024A31C4A|nr:sigma factor [Actinokineospora sp. NBRC 105648]GLZ39898.1 hypothetical protein Acsp05_35220 [Actinokineospora sp. NBRC 105648]
MTNDDLVDAVAQGDQDAFALFYDRLAGPVFGLIRTLVEDRVRAEEIAYEVFLDLWRTAPRYQPGRGGADAWALALAHRHAVGQSHTRSRDRLSR